MSLRIIPGSHKELPSGCADGKLGNPDRLTLARELQVDRIPALLTVEVDVVQKFGESGNIIPSNVGEAVNFYQDHGLIHGQREIRAADPAHTRIIGNFRFDYASSPLRCEGYPWVARVFMKSHIEIECDPLVWEQVASVIRSKFSLEATTRRWAGTDLHPVPFQD